MQQTQTQPNDKQATICCSDYSLLKITEQTVRVTGQTVIGLIFVMPIMVVYSTYEAIKDIKICMNRYYEKQKLLQENENYVIPYYSINKESDSLKNSIYVCDSIHGLERADKKIHLKTNKPVYVTTKSNQILFDYNPLNNAVNNTLNTWRIKKYLNRNQMFLKKMTKLTYLITFENPEVNGIMGEFEEALILVGRLIERLSNEEDNIGKYIYISEYVLNDDGNYIKQDYLQRYLIKKDL